MADNTPLPPKSSALPPLPSSRTTGRLPSPTTHLPPIKKGGAGKIVVMLSSVAKPPPAGTQSLLQVAPLSGSPPKLAPADPSQAVNRPPPLPPKQVTPGNNPQPHARLSATTYVKLPLKTNVPALSSLSGKPIVVPGGTASPPPLPAKASEPKKSGAQHIPPIKLNELSSDADASDESIFPEADQPKGWKNLEPGELNPPAGNLQSLEIFARSQRLLAKPAPETPSPGAKDAAAPLVAPPLVPPSRVEAPPSVVGALPPPLTLAKPTESFATPPPLHVAPPLLEKAPELPPEKLAQPNVPFEARKSETSPDSSGSPGVSQVPPLIQPEAPETGQPPLPQAAKPLLPPAAPVAKGTGSWLKKKSTPLVLSSTSRVQLPKDVEAKPALKPAVLPKRLLPDSKETEVPEAAEKLDAEAPASPAVSVASTAQPPEMGTPPSGEQEKPVAKVLPAQPRPEVPVVPKTNRPLPETRAARAHKRRFSEVVGFYCLLAVTLVALFVGSLYFGRETRVEGQVIPPPGTTLNNEVWVVTNFSSEVSGIAEDLAAERTPILQEIQERQDHVQRAQADVASREERIRVILEQVQASKDEIASLIKESRDATQQIWDGEGARIDEEYASRLNALQKAISDRAKSLNLKYQPDNSFQSPEVWANAYRLALYEVPAGVDSVKEHAWLGDQMKQWRDFLKTLDDRKEQLREKAAQLKLAPAPKVADLNTKIDELQQRIDSTAAEEVPLKAELQQAQTDLAASQTAEAGLDDKWYKELDGRPAANITKRIPLATNGRFTWVQDDPFAEGEKEHHYWIFARATRADGRQYWALGHFSIEKNHKVCLLIEPNSFVSTKAILRPDLSPEEQEQ